METATAPKVITLVWSESSPPDDSCSYDHVTADTPLGVYSIEWKSWKTVDSYSVFFRGEWAGEGFMLDEAKLVAERDFQQKILACIELS